MLLELFNHTLESADIVGIGPLMRRQTGDRQQNELYNPWKAYFNLYLRHYSLLIESDFYELDHQAQRETFDEWTGQYEIVKQLIVSTIKNNKDMSFFQPLHELSPNIDVTMRIKTEGDKITVEYLPASAKTTLPLLVTGTAQELDEGFIQAIRRPMEVVAGLQTNTSEFIAKVEEAAKDDGKSATDAPPPSAAEKKAPASKKAAGKPATPKKPASSKAGAKAKADVAPLAEEPGSEALEAQTTDDVMATTSSSTDESSAPPLYVSAGTMVQVNCPGIHRGKTGKIVDGIVTMTNELEVEIEGCIVNPYFPVKDLEIVLETVVDEEVPTAISTDEQQPLVPETQAQQTGGKAEKPRLKKGNPVVYIGTDPEMSGRVGVLQTLPDAQDAVYVRFNDAPDADAMVHVDNITLFKADQPVPPPPAATEKPTKSTDWVKGEYVRVTAEDSAFHNMVGKLGTHRPAVAGKNPGTLIVEFDAPTGPKIIHASQLQKCDAPVEQQPGEQSDPAQDGGVPSNLSHRELKERFDAASTLDEIEAIHAANAASIDNSSWLKDLYHKRQKDLAPASQDPEAAPEAATTAAPAQTEKNETSAAPVDNEPTLELW